MSPNRTVPTAILALLIALALAPLARADVPAALATLETPTVFDTDEGGSADSDDPAIWVNPLHRRASLVLATKKNAGMDVFDLRGRVLQSFAPPAAPSEDGEAGRFNNVVLALRARIGGRLRDLAVVTDRGRDQLRVYEIDARRAASGLPAVRDVTDPDQDFVFSSGEEEVLEQTTAYGIATYVGPGGGAYVFASRRSRTAITAVRLVDAGHGRVGWRRVDTTSLPASFPLPDGGSWTPCTDPGDLPQVEGMVFDEDSGVLYAGQEDVGIWRIKVGPGGFGRAKLVDRVREFGVPSQLVPDPDEPEDVECEYLFDEDPGFGGTRLSADVEGLTIYRGKRDRDYLLASSQGDDTFAVYGRAGAGRYLGSFAIGDRTLPSGRLIDSVQESDGAHVMSTPLPGFPHGLFVTQDGDDLDAMGAEQDGATNFKFVRWERIARLFDPPLAARR
jgi:3-phytase